MKPTRTGLLLLLVLLGATALVTAFTPPRPPPLRRQNAMRMSYHEDVKPLSPPTDDELEALERRLAPSAAAWLRLASAVVMGGAYLASPVMGAYMERDWCFYLISSASDDPHPSTHTPHKQPRAPPRP